MDSRADLTNEALVATRDLAVGYEGRSLVDGIALQVRQGQIVTLIGPNGAGKSTILKTIAGHLDALGGCVLLSGKDLRDEIGRAHV